MSVLCFLSRASICLDRFDLFFFARGVDLAVFFFVLSDGSFCSIGYVCMCFSFLGSLKDRDLKFVFKYKISSYSLSLSWSDESKFEDD